MFTQQLMRHFPLLLPAALVLLLTTCSDKSVPVGVPNVMPGPYTPEETPATPTPAKTADRIDGSLHPMAYRTLIDGPVDYVSTLRTDALLSNLPTNVDLGGLAKAGGEPVRMIALGGSLTAGVRNGGLYREGQLTAYPNLVARQMGIADFQTPAFGPTEANGTGFMLYSDPTAEYPRWKEVKNNLAPVVMTNVPKLSPYVGRVNNFSAPGLTSYLYNLRWNPNSTADNGTGHLWFDAQPYMWRFIPSEENEKAGLLDYVKQTQPFDFFLLEDRSEEWLKMVRNSDDLDGWSSLGELVYGNFNYGTLAQKLAEGVKKGVVFTVPDYKYYAFMNWYRTDDLKRRASSISIGYSRNGYPNLLSLTANSDFRLLPTASVAKLFSDLKQGDAVNVTLTDADVMDEREIRTTNPDAYNERIRRMAKELNLALVDLNAVYKSIYEGNYITDDGLKIDGSPKGNFFSSDGTYPTAVGQAVIANEVIKAVNNTYQARIPLINVRTFAQTTGAQ